MSMDTQSSGQLYIPGSADTNVQHTTNFALTREFIALGNTKIPLEQSSCVESIHGV